MKKTRNRIIIEIPYFEIDPETKIKDIPSIEFEDAISFNFKEAHLSGVRNSLSRDTLELLFRHPDFPETIEGGRCLRYTLIAARKAFPFLFVEDFNIAERYIDV